MNGASSRVQVIPIDWEALELIDLARSYKLGQLETARLLKYYLGGPICWYCTANDCEACQLND